MELNLYIFNFYNLYNIYKMERKLVKQGAGALTLTLPANWIKKNNLTQEDVVFIKESKNQLILCNNSSINEKETKIDIKNLEKGYAFHLVTGKYIEGYDKIILEHNNLELSQKIGKSFLGMVIEEHTDKHLIMRDIIKIPSDNFVEIFKRSCQILIQQVRLLKKFSEGNATFEQVKKEERLLDSNLFYCLRYINKYEKIENSYKYFLLTTTMESVGDLISEIGEYLKKEKITLKEKEILELIVETVEKYVLYLFQNNMKKMYETLKIKNRNFYQKSFVGGVALAIREALYNYIGYLVPKKE